MMALQWGCAPSSPLAAGLPQTSESHTSAPWKRWAGRSRLAWVDGGVEAWGREGSGHRGNIRRG